MFWSNASTYDEKKIMSDVIDILSNMDQEKEHYPIQNLVSK